MSSRTDSVPIEPAVSTNAIPPSRRGFLRSIVPRAVHATAELRDQGSGRAGHVSALRELPAGELLQQQPVFARRWAVEFTDSGLRIRERDGTEVAFVALPHPDLLVAGHFDQGMTLLEIATRLANHLGGQLRAEQRCADVFLRLAGAALCHPALPPSGR